MMYWISNNQKGLLGALVFLVCLGITATAGPSDSLLRLIESHPQAKKSDSVQIAIWYGELGQAHIQEEKFEEAMLDFDKALGFANRHQKAELYKLFMALNAEANRHDHVLDLGAEAMNQFYDDPVMMISTYHRVAKAYQMQLQKEKALVYFRRALKKAEESGDSTNRVLIQVQYAHVLVNTGQYDSAIYYLRDALGYYQNQADWGGMGKVYHRLGVIYLDFEQVDSARFFLEEARRIHENKAEDLPLIDLNLNLGVLYFGQGLTEESRGRFLDALIYAERLGVIDRHHEIYRYLAALSYHDEKWGEAENYLTLADNYTDSVFSQNHSEAFAAAQAQFSVKENLLKAQLLQKENLEAVREVDWQRQLNLWTLGVAILLGLFLSYIIWQQRKLRHLNEELIQKNEELDDHLHEKDNIMGILVHDLRSPMASIKSLSDLLVTEEDIDLPDDVRELLTELGHVSERGLQMVSTLFRVYELENHMESIQLDRVKLGPLLSDLEEEFRSLAGKKGMTLLVEKNGEEVLSHREFLFSILRNLISNALKFSPDGKSVKIRVDQLKDRARLYIRDEGPGFSAEDRKHMFRKFKKLSAQPTRGETSSGLGLYLVYLMGMRINARIWLNEDYHSGAEFIIELPLYQGTN
ncbi:tetratricopeptide repeat protein [bacterium SCSIO 12741]|nr:tetratricopeptide repeat protein [bacterium SCSIO 12741]